MKSEQGGWYGTKMTVFDCNATALSEFTLEGSNYSRVAACMPSEGFMNVSTGGNPHPEDVLWAIFDEANEVIYEGGTPWHTDGTCSGGEPCSALYDQCGGNEWSGPTCCAQGSCQMQNEWYSQCLM